MVKSLLSMASAFALSVVLSACGGGSSPNPTNNNGGDDVGTMRVTIGGTLTNNSGSVTLSLNGVEEMFSASPFTFTQDLAQDDQYAVLFVSTSTGQQCTISNSVGTAATDITNVLVTCNSPITVLNYPDAEVTGHLSSGDYNGDGFADLVFSIRTLPGHISGSNQEMFRVSFGDGVGGITDTVDIPRLGAADSSKRGHILVSDDYNTDGIDDFAFSGDVLQILVGSNSNNPSAIFTGSNFINAPLHSADIDGNGFSDFLSIIFGGSTRELFSLMRNNGSGSFGAQELVGNMDNTDWNDLCAGAPLSFITGDFNDDMAQDILTIVISCDASGNPNDSHNALALFSGNGAGSFAYPLALDVLSDDLFLGGNYFDTEYKNIASGDFDADGDLDIAITSTTNFVQIMVNDGTGNFTAAQRVIIGTRPIHVRTQDFDLDGMLDLATINQDSKTAVVSLGNGDGTFADNTGSDVRSISIQLDSEVDMFDMEVADMDSDGYPDIILAEDGTNPPNTGRGSVQILYNPAR